MSDVMMLGIATMPYELAMSDEISRRQFYANTQRLVAALEAARGEVDALAKDAARYRWLRDREIPEWLDLWHQNPDRIDDSIDAAMQRTSAQEGSKQ